MTDKFGLDDEFGDDIPDEERETPPEQPQSNPGVPSRDYWKELINKVLRDDGIDPDSVPDDVRDRIDRIADKATELGAEHLKSGLPWSDLTDFESQNTTDHRMFMLTSFGGSSQMFQGQPSAFEQLPMNCAALLKKGDKYTAFGLVINDALTKLVGVPPRTKNIAVFSAAITALTVSLAYQSDHAELVRLMIVSRGWLNVIKPGVVAFEPFRRDTEYGDPLRVMGFCCHVCDADHTDTAYIRGDAGHIGEPINVSNFKLKMSRAEEWNVTLAEIMEGTYANDPLTHLGDTK